MLKDITGAKQMRAITVFAHAIRYLKDHMLKTLDQRGAGIKDRDINWVLTVPAIWDDPAKQFMREAAEEVIILLFTFCHFLRFYKFFYFSILIIYFCCCC
jgi:hypothetical protein